MERIRLAEAAATVEPLNEEAYRTQMQIHAEMGEMGLALQAYSTIYHNLEDELGMDPSGATQDLVVKIKTGRFKTPLRRAISTGVSFDNQVATKSEPLNIPTVAVLPFNSLGPDPIPEYLSHGLLEDMVCTLAKLREPRVISSNSTRDIDVTKRVSTDTFSQLGAEYFVSGTIRCKSSRFQISVQLAVSQTGQVVWAQTYESEENELFGTQGLIARSIAQHLVPSLQSAELRRTKTYSPKNLAAYHLTLKAKEQFLRLSKSSFDYARELLEMAAAKDPNFAPTFVTLADWYSIRMGQGWSWDTKADRIELEKNARIAIALSEDSSRALAMLGHNRTIYDRQYGEACVLFDRALSSAPNDAETLMWSCPTLAYMGEAQQSIERAELAISLSPQDPFLFRFEHFLGIAHYASGNLEAAAYWATSSYQRNPAYTSNLRLAAAALAGLEKYDEAQKFAQNVLLQDAGFTVSGLKRHLPFKEILISHQYAEQLITAGLPR